MEAHLLVCPACLEAVTELRRLHNAFGTLALLTRIQGKAVEAVEAAPEQVLLGQALAAEAQVATPEFQKVLHEWSQRVGRLTHRTFAAMFRSAGSALSLSGPELSQALAASGWFWSAEFSLATLGTRMRGAQRRASRSRPSHHGALEMNWAWVDEKDIEISLSGLPPTARMPFVVLVPLRRDLSFRRRAQLRPDPSKKDRWVARFQDVEAGSYTVALQPLELG